MIIAVEVRVMELRKYFVTTYLTYFSVSLVKITQPFQVLSFNNSPHIDFVQKIKTSLCQWFREVCKPAFISLLMTLPVIAQGQWENERWMGDDWEIIKDRKLNDIVIPGSHDAGTYGVGIQEGSMFNPWVHYALDADSPMQYCKAVLQQPPSICAGYAKAQSLSIYDQLRAGSRYFDLRFARVYDPESEEYAYRIHHSFLGHTQQEIFNDFQRFLQEPGHEKEIIFLAFTQMIGLSGAEIITNGDFESGDLTGWDSSGNDTNIAVTSPGAYGSVYAVNIDASAGPVNLTLKQTPDISDRKLKADQRVTVSFDWKGTTAAGGQVSIDLISKDENGVISQSLPVSVLSGATLQADWTSVGPITLNVGPDIKGGVSLQVSASCDGDAACRSNLMLDHVSIINQKVFPFSPAEHTEFLSGFADFNLTRYMYPYNSAWESTITPQDIVNDGKQLIVYYPTESTAIADDAHQYASTSFARNKLWSKFGCGDNFFPYPDPVKWGSEDALANDWLSSLGGKNGDIRMCKIGIAFGVDDGFKMFLNTINPDPGVHGWADLEDAAKFSNPRMVPHLITRPRAHLNIVGNDHIQYGGLVDEARRLNKIPARVTVKIISIESGVTEECGPNHVFSEECDFYPVFVTNGDESEEPVESLSLAHQRGRVIDDKNNVYRGTSIPDNYWVYTTAVEWDKPLGSYIQIWDDDTEDGFGLSTLR